jgi:hypothetical protein
VSGTGFAPDTEIEIYYQVNEYPVPHLGMLPEDAAELMTGYVNVTPTTNLAGAAPMTDSAGNFTGDNAVRLSPLLNTMGPRTKIKVVTGAESTEVWFGISPSIKATPDVGSGMVTITGSGFKGTPALTGFRMANLATILVGMNVVPTIPSPVLTSISGAVLASIAIPTDLPAMGYAVVCLSGDLSVTTSFTLLEPGGPAGPEGPEGPQGAEGEGTSTALPIVAIILAAIAIVAALLLLYQSLVRK